jgi:chromosome segregation ATPase
MDNKQERRDEIQRKIRELERELTEIDLRDSGWNTEREQQLEKEIENLRLELEELSTNQD